MDGVEARVPAVVGDGGAAKHFGARSVDDAGFFGGAFDVDAVLVGAGGEDDFVAEHALVATDGVAHDRGVGVADVREAVGVVDRSR